MERKSFWQRLQSWAGWHILPTTRETSGPFESITTEAGTTVSPDSALKLSAVWACVGLRSATVSSLPLHLRDAEKKFAKDHPLYRILHDAPNADMTASEFWESVVASLDMWGNAFAEIEREGNRIVALTPLRPERMTVERTTTGTIRYRYRVKGLESDSRTYDEADILHIKGFTVDGLVGLSPLQYAADTLGGLSDANRAAARMFKNGLKAGGFLETGAAALTQEQRDRLRAALASFGLPENAGKWMVLEAGMKPSAQVGMAVNPVDAELLESRYFGIEEICRAFRVPPTLIGHTDKASSWASSLENTNLGFLTYSLRPTLVRIEQAISKKLLTGNERDKYRAKFSVEGLLRADSAGRATYLSTMTQNGLMSRNEARALEDLQPVDGGDALTVQLNLTTIDKVGLDKPEPVPALPPPAKAAEPINIQVNVADRKAQGFTILRNENGLAVVKPIT